MRISDWSSDVCSSDLSGDDSSGIQPDLPTRRETGLFPSAFVPIWTCRSGNEARSGACVKENGMTDLTNLSFQPDDEHPRISTGSAGLDRKSVVTGKSGSVSVDLGGRRIIKKKK